VICLIGGKKTAVFGENNRPVFCVLYVAIFLECPSFDYSFRFSPTFIPKDVNVRVLVAVKTLDMSPPTTTLAKDKPNIVYYGNCNEHQNTD
jgi:hypothetical protein